MSPPVDGCVKYPFPHRSFRMPVKKRLTWKLRPAFESVSLFIYCEPNIVDRAFVIDLIKNGKQIVIAAAHGIKCGIKFPLF